MMKDKILKEAYEVLEYTSYEDIEKDFIKAGFTLNITEIEIDEEIQEYSTDVDWDSSFEATKNDVTVKVFVSGAAIAEISYGNWCTTFGHDIEDFSAEILTEVSGVE